MPARFILICGLPGAGKTALAKRIEKSESAVRLCPDEWMQALEIDLYDEKARANIEELQWTLAKHLLTLGQSVIIEWGTWGRAERDRLRTEAQALGASAELHYLKQPLETLWQRTRDRGMEEPPPTREDLERSFAAFQEPDEQELALFDPPAKP